MGKRKQEQPADKKRKAGCSSRVWLIAGAMFILYAIGTANPSSRQKISPTTRPTEAVMIAATVTLPSIRIQTPSAVPTIDEAGRLAETITNIDGMIEAEVILGVVVYIEAVVEPGFSATDTAEAVRKIVEQAGYDSEEMTVILSDGVLPIDYTWRDNAWRITEMRQIATANATMFGSPTPFSTRTPSVSSPSPTIAFSPEPGAAMDLELTVYTSGSARLRSCASTSCSIVVTLGAGEELQTISAENGDEVEAGNVIWYKVKYGDQIAYVYSSLVSSQRPAAAPVTTGGGNVTSPSTAVVPASPVPVVVTSPFGCNGIDDLNCDDFRAIGQNANAHLAACGDEDRLDADGDGHACER